MNSHCFDLHFDAVDHVTDCCIKLLYPFNDPLSGTAWVIWYRKGKTSLYLLEQEIVSGNGTAGPYTNLHLAPDR